MNTRNLIPAVIAAAAATVLSPGTMFPEVIHILFVYPSAVIASVFSGAALVTEGSDPVLIHRLITVQVVPECSGYSFWTILFSLTLWQAIKPVNAKSCRFIIPVLLPVSWAVAVFANGLRISAAIQVTVISHALLPKSFAAGIHEWTGFLVFFPILCGSYFLMQKRLNHANRQSREKH
jgi:exosortase/archaeosortase family protein